MKKAKIIAALAAAAALCTLPLVTACSKTEGGNKFSIASYAPDLSEDSSLLFKDGNGVGSIAKKSWTDVYTYSNDIAVVTNGDADSTKSLYDLANDKAIASGVSVTRKTYYATSPYISIYYYEVKVSETEGGADEATSTYQYYNQYGEALGNGSYTFLTNQSSRVSFENLGSKYIKDLEDVMESVYKFTVLAREDADDAEDKEYYYRVNTDEEVSSKWIEIEEDGFSNSYPYQAGDTLGVKTTNVYGATKKKYPDAKNIDYGYVSTVDSYGTRYTFYNKDVLVGNVYLNSACTRLNFVGDYLYYYELTPVDAEATTGYNYELTSIDGSIDSTVTLKFNYRLYRYNFVKGGKAEAVDTDYVFISSESRLYNYKDNCFDRFVVRAIKKVDDVARSVNGNGTERLIVDQKLNVSFDLSGWGVDLDNIVKLSETRFVVGDKVYDEKYNLLFNLPSSYYRVWVEEESIVCSTGSATLVIDYDGAIKYNIAGTASLVDGKLLGVYNGEYKIYSEDNPDGKDALESITYNKDEDVAGVYENFIYKVVEVEDDSYSYGSLYTITIYDLTGKSILTIDNCTNPANVLSNIQKVVTEDATRYLVRVPVWDKDAEQTVTAYYFG